jgi:hypothetical protein
VADKVVEPGKVIGEVAPVVRDEMLALLTVREAQVPVNTLLLVSPL